MMDHPLHFFTNTKGRVKAAKIKPNNMPNVEKHLGKGV